MLTHDTILRAFERLSDILGESGRIGEIQLLGGTAMMLAFQARPATKDVDAIFAPARAIRDAARRVAEELGLAEDWLNDGAKAFASPDGDFSERFVPQFPWLRIVAPTPEYMLAMKVISVRVPTSVEKGDKDDIGLLIDRLGLRSAAGVMDIVTKYYAPSMITPRSMYLIDEIMDERSARREDPQ